LPDRHLACRASSCVQACLAALLALAAWPAQAGGELAYTVQPLTAGGRIWPLRVPQGLRLELLTADLDGARMPVFLPNDDLLIGSSSGAIYRLTPPYTHARVLTRLPGYPHSLAWRDGQLLIARTSGLYGVPYRPGQDGINLSKLALLARLPGGAGHNSRTVAIGPDERVYLSLGISGNCSDEYLDPSYPFERRRGGVLVLDEDSRPPRWRTFAAGLRNPVGFDWHPVTGRLYAANNGPDHLGFEQPPEYFSRLDAGSFHGMPWFQFDGETMRRDTCIKGDPPRPVQDVIEPRATFPARNAPMGVAFVPTGVLDARFEANAVVALKGSWGTRPDGAYSGDPATRRPPGLVMVRFENGEAAGVVDLVSGFQAADGERLARPVGVAAGPDGALYFTSDSGIEGLFRLSVQQ